MYLRLHTPVPTALTLVPVQEIDSVSKSKQMHPAVPKDPTGGSLR